jgi:hypothetical protein
MVDYGDPSLREGHCKANPLPTYPHRGRNAIVRALEALVEVGKLPWGMTVCEVVAEAQSDPDRYNWRKDPFDPSIVTAPVDVADLIFVAPDDSGRKASSGTTRS